MGFASLYPSYISANSFAWRASAIVSATAANWHDGQITSDFQKSRQARESKIFRFRSHANHSA